MKEAESIKFKRPTIKLYTFGFRGPISLFEKIESLANKHGITRSRLILTILDDYFKENNTEDNLSHD